MFLLRLGTFQLGQCAFTNICTEAKSHNGTMKPRLEARLCNSFKCRADPEHHLYGQKPPGGLVDLLMHVSPGNI